jgi:hypothetical protein
MNSHRLAWRAAVQASNLPAAVKVALLAHSTAGRHHWHDEKRNLHGCTRRQVAAEAGQDQRSISRHFVRAESEGWLARHDGGHRGLQLRFHYLIPGGRNPCADCRIRMQTQPRKGDTDPARMGDSDPAELGDRNHLSERRTKRQERDIACDLSIQPTVFPSNSYLQVEVPVTGAATPTANRSPADRDDHEPSIPVLKASFTRSLTIGTPKTDASPITGSGPKVTAGGETGSQNVAPSARSSCRICDGQLVGPVQHLAQLCGPHWLAENRRSV